MVAFGFGNFARDGSCGRIVTMNYKTGKIVGRSGEQKWVMVHEFEEGKLWVIVELGRRDENEGQVELMSRGREIMSSVAEKYLAGQELKSVVEQIREGHAEAEIVAMSVDGGKIDVVVAGTGGMWVKMGEREGWVIKPTHDSGEDKVKQVRGTKMGQTMVIGSGGFWKPMGEGMVRAALGDDWERALEMLAAVVHEEEGGGGIVVQFEVEPRVEQVVPSNVSDPEDEVIINQSSNLPEMVDEDEEQEAPIKEKRPVRGERFKNWSGGVLAKIADKLPKKSSGTVYLAKEPTMGKKKVGWIVGLGFAILFAVVVGVGQARRIKIDRQKSGIDEKIAQVIARFDEAKALTTLDPARSRNLLAEVKEGLDGIDEKEKKENTRLAEIESSFGQVLGEASGLRTLTPREVFDLSLLREDMVGNKLGASSDMTSGLRLVVWDEGGTRLVKLDLTKKSGEVIVAGDLVQGGKLIATYPEKVVVLGDKGIVECIVQNAKCKIVVERDGEWGEIADMQMFAGNIYLLDSAKPQIWRYQVIESGYGARQGWLEEAAIVDLKGKHMAIDGNIWVIDGSVVKFNRGIKDNFVMEELDKPLSEDTKIFTYEDAEELFMWDKGNARIVVVKKTGEYERQYRDDALGRATDMTMVANKIYWSEGSKIWEASL